jgi:iron(III) transport system substrate-binding protein
VALLAGTPDSACAQTDTALAHPTDPVLIAAVKAEGAVSFYGSSSVLALKSDADKFQATYGIPVTYTALTSGPLTARVDQEIAAGTMQPDVIISADYAAMDKWAAAGLFAKLPDVDYPKRSPYNALVQIVYQALFFNTAAVSGADVPKTWNDVLNPRFRGKIVLGSPRIAPGYSTLYYALWKDPRYGRPFFEKLAAAGARVVQSTVLVAQSVASGEAVLGFTGLPYDVVNLKRQAPDAPIDYRYLDIITAAPSLISINARAKHPKAAELFARWMMSPAGQVAHNGDGRASSVLGDLPGTLKSADVKKVLNIDTTEVAKGYKDLIAMFDAVFK